MTESQQIKVKTIDVFVSYAHANHDFALEVTEKMLAQGLKVFNCAKDLEWGQSISSVIESRMDTSRAFVVFLSKDFLTSEWCQRELKSISSRNENSLILPIRLDDCELPKELSGVLCLDGGGLSPALIANRVRESLNSWSATQGSDCELLDDEQLTERVHTNRDVQAFQVLFDRYYPSLRHYVSRRLLIQNDVDDVVNETFLRLWDLLGRKQLTEAPSPGLLYSLARRVCIDQSRRKNQQPFPSILPQDQPEDQNTLSPTASAELSEATQSLRSAIEALPEEERIVIELRLFRDFSIREIAKTLSISEYAARSRFHWAMKRLRNILQHALDE